MKKHETPRLVVVLVTIVVLVFAGIIGNDLLPEDRKVTRTINRLVRPKNDLPSTVFVGPPIPARETPTPTPLPKPPEPFFARLPAGAAQDAPTSEPIELAMLLPPGDVSGWVLTKEGGPAVDAEVVATFEDLVPGGKPSPTYYSYTGSRGDFLIRALPPGVWTITARKEGYGPGHTTGVAVQSHELTTSVEVHLTPAVGVRGEVRTTTSLAVEGAQVTLARQLLTVSERDGTVNSSELGQMEDITDRSGRFGFDEVGTGSHVLTVHAEGFASERQLLNVEPGRQESILVELEPGASIGGIVRTSGGRPIAGAVVTVKDPLDNVFTESVVTREQGAFRVDGLREEHVYSVSAKAPGFSPAGPYAVQSGRMENVIVMGSGGAIEGMVRHMAANAPMANVPLVLESTAGGFPVRLRDVSTSGGRYRFDFLPSGAYNVRVDGTKLTAQPRLNVEVRGSSVTSGVDFLVYPGVDVTGFVKEVHTNDPISGASLLISTVNGLPLLLPENTRAKTDEMGKFEFENLPHGTYRIEASADGYERYPGPDGSAEVAVYRDASPGPVTLLLSRGGSVHGHVLLGRGKPVEGARVQLFNVKDALDPIDTSRLAATTDATGFYEIKGVPIDKERLLVAVAAAQKLPRGQSNTVAISEFLPEAIADVTMAEGCRVTVRVVTAAGTGLGMADVKLEHLDLAGDPWPELWSKQTSPFGNTVFEAVPFGDIKVSASKEEYVSAEEETLLDPELGDEGITLTLEPAQAISGVVVDDTGNPVNGGIVEALDDARELLSSCEINGMGRFSLDGLRNGPCDLMFWARRDTPAGAMNVGFFLPGQRPAPAEIRVEIPMAGAIEGQVLEAETTRPIRGATVSIEGEYEIKGWGETSISLTTITGDPPGGFKFSGLPPGNYTIRASTADRLEESTGGISVSPKATMSAGKILLKLGQSLKARVTDAATEDPVAGATVFMEPTDMAAVSNSQGEIFLRPVEPGIYTLVAEHPRYLRLTKELVQVTGREETDAGNLQLVKGASIDCTVTGPDSRPIRGATVTAEHATMRIKKTQNTDGGGRTLFEGLEEGGWRVSAEARLGQSTVVKMAEVLVSAGEDQSVEIELTGNARLEGPLAAPPGGDTARIEVTAYLLDSAGIPLINSPIRADTDATWYVLRELAEGKYLLVARSPLRSESARWWTVAEARAPTSSAPLIAPNTRLHGRAYRMPDETAVPGAIVRLRAISSPQSGMGPLQPWWEWTTRTDEFGLFEFRNLAAGTYEVVAFGSTQKDIVLDVVEFTGAPGTMSFDLVFGQAAGPPAPDQKEEP